VRFPACGSGGALGPGTYRVIALQHVLTRAQPPEAGPITVVSAPVDLTVARTGPATDAAGRPTTRQPAWLAGTPVACGMAAGALALLPGYFPTYLTVSSANRGRWIGVEVRNVAGGPAPVPTGARTAVAWVRGGRVVSVGADELAHPRTTVVPSDGEAALAADLADTTNTCGPRAGGRYAQHLAPGAYTAIPYARVGGPRTTSRETAGWIVGLPTPVTVDARGRVRVG
jgi:hypothetical protein